MSGGALSQHLVGQGSVLAAERTLPVASPLQPLFPGGGLRRGSLASVSGRGASTLLLSLLAEPLAQGSWAAVVGLADLGMEAAAGLGVDLRRLAWVPEPGPRWTAVVAVLLEACDLVVVGPPGSCRSGVGRRLAARAREQGSVLLVAEGAWPERPDMELVVEAGDWEGLGHGTGMLRRRPARVVLSGRRGAGRARAVTCWLPGEDGRLAPRRVREEPTEEQADGGEVLPWVG